MKRKELYNYIKEEIVGALSEAGEKTAMITTQSGETSAIDYKTNDELNKLKDNSDIKGIKTGTGQKIKESDLEEMARKAGGYRAGDASKFAEAKELYSTGLYADVLKAIEEAGEDGITQKELGAKLGKGDGTFLNNILNKFKAIGVLGGGKLAAAEKPSGAAPEAEPEKEEVDDFFKADDEETTPEEKPVAVSDKEIEKVVGKTKTVANLSPEDEEKFNKFKKGIESKITRLKDMSAAKRIKSDDLKVLKQLISRDDIKKLFNAKGINVMDYLKDL